MAMPATGALIGTPASSSDRVEAQTEPIEVEPLEPSASETLADRVGELLARRAAPAAARARRARRGRSRGASASRRDRSHRWRTAGSCSGACSACVLRGRACRAAAPCVSMSSVVTPRIWVSPRSNSAEPCDARDHADLGGQRADVGEAAAVDADLVAQHALAHELLGQRAERRADLLLAALELAGRAARAAAALISSSACARAPACRRWSCAAASVGLGGGLDGVVDVVLVVEEDRELAGSAWRPPRRARPAPRTSCLMNGLAASRPLGDDLLGRRLGAALRRGRQVCSVASASTIMIATSPSSSDAAGDDHVEDGVLELAVGREGDPLAVDQGDADAADRAGERQAGELGGQRRGVDREHVVRVRRGRAP